MTDLSIQRALAEQAYAEELDQLAHNDRRPRPPNWRLSPWAVAAYVLGATLDNGFVVSAKYIGNPRTIEIAIATLTTDRALLLLGVPGTGKTWVSEHLAAAVSGDSTLLVPVSYTHLDVYKRQGPFQAGDGPACQRGSVPAPDRHRVL